MKLIKNMLFKRIVIYLCCTVLFSSSLFISYTSPVYAETTYADLIKDAVDIALAAAGIWAVAQTGGALAPVLIPYIVALAGAGFDVYDYVTQDEAAGTTTISADFVNLVLQAYQQYKEENGEKFDGVMEPGSDGYYHFGQCQFTLSYPGSNGYAMNWSDITTSFPCAHLIRNYYDNGTGSHETMAYIIFYNSGDDKFYCTDKIYENGSLDPDFEQALSGYLCPVQSKYVRENGYTGNAYFVSHRWGFSSGAPSNSYITVYSSTIPSYTNLGALKQALRTGDFSYAQNYGKVSDCESPAYTGTYNGGDITILTSSLNALREKLEELEKSNKSLEEKLKELLEYLKSSGGGGGSGGDVNVDIDLSTTNGLLSKILAKVTQIFDKLSDTATDTFESIDLSTTNGLLSQILDKATQIFDKLSETTSGAVDTVNTKLQETLDEILSTLKSIRRWTIADTVFDGVDALANIASFLKDFLTAPAAAIGTAASSLGETANMLTDRFPFSIPWDMAALVTLLSAEPQAPVFKLPITIDSAGIEEYMEIDMSQFEYLSTLMRGILSILYAYGILNMTTKVINTGGKK